MRSIKITFAGVFFRALAAANPAKAPADDDDSSLRHALPRFISLSPNSLRLYNAPESRDRGAFFLSGKVRWALL